MRTANKILMTVLAGIIGMASAQASVVYDWRPIAGTDRFETTGGHLVVTDAAYRSGSVGYHYQREPTLVGYTPEPGVNYFPESPVLSASLQLVVPGEAKPDFNNSDFNIISQPRDMLFNSKRWFYGNFGVNFIDGLLTGSLSLNDQESNFAMTSGDDGNLWTIGRFNSDRLAGFCDGGCDGATGRWVLASAVPSDVPSPAIWGLFLLAVLAALGMGTARQYRGVGISD